MTAHELAKMLRARKIGKGKWIAHCPAHRDRHASMTITEGNKVPVLLLCRSAGCDTRDILKAMGLTWKDVMGERIHDPVLRIRMSREAQAEAAKESWLSARLLMSVEPEKAKYWQTVALNAHADWQRLRCRLEPESIFREYRGRVWLNMSQTQRDRYLEGVYYRQILPLKNPEYGL